MVDKEKAGVGSGEMSLLSAEQFEKPNRYVIFYHRHTCVYFSIVYSSSIVLLYTVDSVDKHTSS
jgi:hypothetical protein